MKVVIRTDASKLIGTGHVMRCLTLADQLKQAGAEVLFICRAHDGNMNGLISQHGYIVRALPGPDENHNLSAVGEYARWLGVPMEQDAEETAEAIQGESVDYDWLVVDHYGIDGHWEKRLRQDVEKIMVIDDLANRSHDCDLLLDQTYVHNYRDRYRDLVPQHCRQYLGPQHALLRSEFAEARRTLRPRNGQVKRIMVFMGGVDPSNETGKVVDALIRLNRSEIPVDIVIGGRNPHHRQIKSLASGYSYFTVHKNINCMATIMAKADLAVGAGGTTTWERCYLGLPTITVLIAENQREMIESLDKNNITINAGWYENLSTADLTNLIAKVISAPHRLAVMEQASLALMSSTGDTLQHPVIEKIMECSHVMA